jgi:tryptophan synthase alpha chain
MTGLEHIAATFSRTKAEGRSALMPYFTLGFPTNAGSLAVLEAIAANGADLIELGIPFSDPLADGPTIQHSTQVALENAVTIPGCFDMVRRLRERHVTQPFLLMGYYNPIFSYGAARYAADAQAAGADGLIVPDLPLEEAAELEAACRENGLAFVYLVAPTTLDERLSRLAQHSSGFVYIVSVVGTTGARSQLPIQLNPLIQKIRLETNKPLAVGFGISTPDQAASVGRMAEGVIVGSALIDVVEKADDPVRAAGNFVKNLANALRESENLS